MHLKYVKIILMILVFPALTVANSDSLLKKRTALMSQYRAFNGSVSVSTQMNVMQQIIQIDDRIIENYSKPLRDFTAASQRLQSVQQEKQIYLAQNIQLSKEIEEMKREQVMLYIIAGFLGLLFIGLFILFFAQLKKINDLALEAQDLYHINENMRTNLETYEKRYYHMKEKHEGINSELLKLREITAQTEKDYALIEEQLHEEKRKNQVLSQKLNKLNKN